MHLLSVLAAIGLLALTFGQAQAQTAGAESKFCNGSGLDHWVVFGSIAGNTRSAEGWFKMADGECRDIYRGTSPDTRLYFYAQTDILITGERFTSWSSGEFFCVKSEAFKTSQHEPCEPGFSRIAFQEAPRERGGIGECGPQCLASHGIDDSPPVMTMAEFLKRHPKKRAIDYGYAEFPNTVIDSATARCLLHPRALLQTLDSIVMNVARAADAHSRIRAIFANPDWGNEALTTRTAILERIADYQKRTAQELAEAAQTKAEYDEKFRRMTEFVDEQERRAMSCALDLECELRHDPTEDNARLLQSARDNYADMQSFSRGRLAIFEHGIGWNRCVLQARYLTE